MTDNLLEIPGESAEPAELTLPRAAALACSLANEEIDYARLLQCQTADGVQSVLLEVDVEVPQAPCHPIKATEPIAVRFDVADTTMPEVLSLRSDFPRVPHLNLRTQEFPRSLCLYDRAFADLKRSWTPHRFVERIREWLAFTARGRLHQDDQPLEPLLLMSHGHIILPPQILEPTFSADGIDVSTISLEPGDYMLVGQLDGETNEHPNVLTIVLRGEAQPHGCIHATPRTLSKLDAFARSAGLSITDSVRAKLLTWHGDDTLRARMTESMIAIVLLLPKTRGNDTGVEKTDAWAFLSTTSIAEVGAALGLWQMQGQSLPRLLGEPEPNGDPTLILLNPSFWLTRDYAAQLNGVSPSEAKIVAIGAGALGSQVVLNAARSGLGKWTLIDHDRLLPHNVARHALTGHYVGYSKAETMAWHVRGVLIDAEISQITADILSPGDQDDALAAAIDDADLLLDMSASVTVARALARRAGGPRRCSLFMNPSGTDLVMLAEDTARSITLTDLEMQYYRLVRRDERLQRHLGVQPDRVRYARSCNDVSSRIAHDLTAMHGAIGSRALRPLVESDGPAIRLWVSDEDGGVEHVRIAPRTPIRHQIGEWTLCTDEVLLEELARIRGTKLPNETGGVLLGSFDMDNRVIHIVDALGAPPDSEEWPTLFIRGSSGLLREIERTAKVTNEALEYVGEWHSHPEGCSTGPSTEDFQVFAWLTEHMAHEGLPAVMMIAGDNGRASCFVGQLERAERLLPEAVT